MGKRRFLIGFIFLIVSILFGGCGIPQEEYNNALNELNSVRNDLNESRARVSELISDIEESNAVIEEKNTKIGRLNEELNNLKKVYPARDFSSLRELQDCLLNDNVSDKTSLWLTMLLP